MESGSTDTSREVMRQKKAKTFNVPSPDLADMECTQLVSPEDVRVPTDPSTLMSTLINEADSALRSARPPVPVNSLRDARYGLRGVRVGEASHPGPPKLTVRLEESVGAKCRRQCPSGPQRTTCLALLPTCRSVSRTRSSRLVQPRTSSTGIPRAQRCTAKWNA